MAIRTVKPVTGIKGMDVVLANLNREILAIQGRSMVGLIEAAILIRNDMDKTSPLIPVDTGNLRGSWFTNPIREGNKFGLLMGFGANYATFVHEMVDADFTSPRVRYGPGKGRKRIYTPRPGAGAKFFEEALKRNKGQILSIIQRNAKIK